MVERRRIETEDSSVGIVQEAFEWGEKHVFLQGGGVANLPGESEWRSDRTKDVRRVWCGVSA